MLIKSAKLKHWTLHFQREFGKWSCASHQSYSTTKRLTYLHNSSTKAELCLVGIDHVSQQSVEHVRHAIRQFKPRILALELCKERAAYLFSSETQKAPSWRDLFEMEGGLKRRLVDFALVSFYSQLAEKNGNSAPGDEMRVAVMEGRALGARIMYIDQDIDVVTSRVSEEISVWNVIKFCWKAPGVLKQHRNLHGELLKIGKILAGLRAGKQNTKEFGQHIDACLQSGLLEEAIELGDQHVPRMMKAVVHERNEYMVTKLRSLQGKVLAVVGALHLPGMCKLWQDAEERVKQKNLQGTATRTESKSVRKS